MKLGLGRVIYKGLSQFQDDVSLISLVCVYHKWISNARCPISQGVSVGKSGGACQETPLGKTNSDKWRLSGVLEVIQFVAVMAENMRLYEEREF